MADSCFPASDHALPLGVMLRVEVLGPLKVSAADGTDLTPTGERELTAMALLAMAAPSVVSTDRLVEELYGDAVPGDPRNAVQAVISRLRKALGRSAGVVETQRNGYRLVDILLDADEASEKLLAANQLAGPARSEAFRSALECWTGTVLDGITGSTTIDAERFRLTELRAGAQEGVFEERLERGEHQTLVAELELAVRDEPLRETRWALLMTALYRDDRQAEALRAYQRARDLLAQRLGLEPGPNLQRLEQQILNHDPDLHLDPGPDREPLTAGGPSSDRGYTDLPSGMLPSGMLPSGMISALLCDVEGSVRRWESDPAETAKQMADLHQAWGEVVAGHQGHLVKSTGDGILAVFSTAADAIGAAVEGQRRQGHLTVRVAITTGQAAPVEDDYRGSLVNRCARLLELAAGGQILATAPTLSLARDALDSSIRDRSLGVQWLRDVPQPVEIFQIDGPGLATNFPPLRSAGSTSLPRVRVGLFGRDDLRAQVVEAIDQHALTTLVGPGGIGKTSVALVAAWELAGNRTVTFVDLASSNDTVAVAARVADAVSHSDDDRSPAQRVIDRLSANTDLIVLDNAEHVLDPIAELVDEVLAHDLKGSFLVTSRHPLALEGETVVAVPPLELPADAADLSETASTPAVALFLERLGRAQPDYELPDGLLPVVAHICRRLDGMPLAIELAASRASVLAVEDIAARLDDQLRLLRQVPATRERRHRSLETVVSWSVDQLPHSAQRLFPLLSAFAGHFGLDGAEAVAANAGLDTIDLLDDLAELSAASLLSVEGGSRYRMLEPIRQFADSELGDRGHGLWAHARWIADLLAAAHVSDGGQRGQAFDATGHEADQIRAAIDRTAEYGFVDLVPDLAVAGGWWFLTRDPVRGAELFQRVVLSIDQTRHPVEHALAVLARATTTAAHPSDYGNEELVAALSTLDEIDHPSRGVARIVAGFASAQEGELEAALALLAEAEGIVSSDNVWESAVVDMAALGFLSLTLMTGPVEGTDFSTAITRGERAAASFRQLSEDWALGVTLGELGRLKQSEGDLDGAEACLRESLELLDDRQFHGRHYIFTELALLASRQGDHDAASTYHAQALAGAVGDGGRSCIASSLAGMACSAACRGDLDEAVGLYEEALALSETDGPVDDPVNDGAQGMALTGIEAEWADELTRLRGLVDPTV